MNLTEHYNYLYSSSIHKIKQSNVEIDDQIDSSTDTRYGVTLLFRPSTLVRENFQKFIDKAKLKEPFQYFYPIFDMHITVMSIISCYNGFKLENINIGDYKSVIQNSISGLEKFRIKFKGITASTNCIMIKGFPENETLNQIRDNLRNNFLQTDLEQSLDKRYKIQTAHSTIIRFKKPLNKKKEFLNFLSKNENYDFGSSIISELEFVANDWYQRKENLKLLATFKLKNTSTL